MAEPVVTLIAAVSVDGFISRGRGVPWDLPEDRAHFRRYTADKWLLLGRITYEEMRGWFRGHTPLVLTHDSGCKPAPGHRVASVKEAMELAASARQDEIVVCGGAQIYALAMPHATRLIVTRVDERLGSGLPFPGISSSEWLHDKKTPWLSSVSSGLRYSIEEYDRVKGR